MEINVLESGKTMLKLELVGKTHTFANALSKELWNDAETLVAGYNVKHPQVSNAILVLETKKKDDTLSQPESVDKDDKSEYDAVVIDDWEVDYENEKN